MSDLASLCDEIESSLREIGDPDRAAQSKAYLKSDLVHLGVTVPDMRRLTLSFMAEHEELDHDDLLALALSLWSSPVFDPRRVGLELLVQTAEEGKVTDLPSLERMLRLASTWALVDEMAIKVVGSIFERDHASTTILDRWSSDEDFWIRRSAMLALLDPIRAGAGDFDRFCTYADQMLDEKEFFIRKAIGWVLREAAKKRPTLVYEWLLPRAARASGVTMREAVKYLSEEQRSSLLARRD